MNKGERLEKLIKESHYKNVNQVSKATGIPYTTIKSFIERDLEKASIDAVVKISNVLGVTVEELIGENTPVIDAPKKSYTYYPTAISAGLPLEVDGMTESSKITVSDELLGKWSNNKNIFFAHINGESMNRLMEDGSLIAIKPVSNTDELKNGDIVVYSVDGEYSVKHYYKYGDTLVFKPNSTIEHEEHTYNVNDNIIIYGVVVTYIINVD